MKKIVDGIISVLFLAACTPDAPDGQDSEPVEMTVDTVAEDTAMEADSGSSPDTDDVRRVVELEMCSVLIRFNFIGDTAQSVEFENHNDITALVVVENNTTDGVVVENCLWPQGSVAGGEDEEDVTFKKSHQLHIEVSLGTDIWAYVCSETLDDLVDSFDSCIDQTVNFPF